MVEFTLVINIILSLLSGEKIPFEKDNGLIFLSVTVDGEIQQFLLDTGCSDILIDGTVHRTDVVLESIYGAMPSSYTSLENVQIGNEIVESIDGLRSDLSRLRMGKENIDGILGMSFWDNHIVSINYHLGLMTFLDDVTKAEMTKNRNIFSFPIIKGENNAPLVMIESDHEKLLFLLDTGANVHAVKDDFVEQVGKYLQLKNNKKVVTIPIKNPSQDLASIYTINNDGGLDTSTFHGILSLHQLGFDQIILDFKNDELVLIK